MKLLAILELSSIIMTGLGVGWLYHPGAGLAVAGLMLFYETAQKAN